MLVDAYSRKVFNMAFQFTGSHPEAEDLTQEIFMKVYSSLGKFDVEKNFTAWLLTLAKNHLIDEYRRTKWEKRNRDDFEEVLLHEPGRGGAVEEGAVQEENRKVLWQGLNRLPSEVKILQEQKEA
jgi:RNA polymerase sigma-70 factor (ECF subfamily)